MLSLYKELVLDKLSLVNKYTTKAMGIDPGYGSSKFAIVIVEMLNKHETLRVVYAKEFEKAKAAKKRMVELCQNLKMITILRIVILMVLIHPSLWTLR